MASKVTVRVLFFGMVKDIVGSAAETASVDAGSTLDSLFQHYAARYPQLAPLSPSLLLAVNQEFAPRSTAIKEGDEVAFLPPVSGGTGWLQRVVTPEGHFFGITRDPLDAPALARQLLQGQDGAIATFEGVVRNNTKGRTTLYLDYEGYEPMAIRAMADIGRDLAAAHDISRIGIIHRLGRLHIGEASVAVVVTSPHRVASFEACLAGINRLKKTVPIWKKEYFADGEIWVDGEWDASLLQQPSR